MSTADEIAKLDQLRQSGALTDAEFQAEKATVLSTSTLPPSPLTRTSTLPAGAGLAGLGGLLAVISSILPWLTAHFGLASLSRNAFQFGDKLGFSVDGVVLILLGSVAIIASIAAATRTSMPVYLSRSPIGLGIGVLILAAIDTKSSADLR